MSVHQIQAWLKNKKKVEKHPIFMNL